MTATVRSQPTTPVTYRRRRLAVLLVLVALVLSIGAVLGGVGAQAELEDPVAGHVVITPGDTLWDVAVDSAPRGVDPREQLASIRELNGLEGAEVEAWTVLLLPAR